MVRETARVALDAWLKVVRLPFDTAAKVLPNGTEGPRNGALLAIDRADATVRATVGGFLNDPAIIEDAQRRRVAADKRAQALHLRVVADNKASQADARRDEKVEAAEQRRREAEGAAETNRRAIEQKETERKRKAAEQAAAQKRAVAESKSRQLRAVQSNAKRERVKVLEETEAALDSKTEALTAADEALRLRREANKAKAARKDS